MMCQHNKCLLVESHIRSCVKVKINKNKVYKTKFTLIHVTLLIHKLRICCRATRYTSNLSLHRRVGLHPLSLRRKLELLKVMFRRTRGLIGTPILDIALNRPQTRYSSDEFVRPNSTRFLNSVTYQGPKIWASLPNYIKACEDLDSFTREAKKYLDLEMSALTSI